MALLISDKIDFTINTVTRDKEGHYIMIRVSIQEEDTTIVNIFAPNRAPQYIRHLLSGGSEKHFDNGFIRREKVDGINEIKCY